jgi:hypothetical protein
MPALLCYPDFIKPHLFHLYTDKSDHQLGAVIMQDKKPIDFIRESSIQLKSGIQPLRESCYQLLKPARLQGLQEYPIRLPHHSLYRP